MEMRFDFPPSFSFLLLKRLCIIEALAAERSVSEAVPHHDVLPLIGRNTLLAAKKNASSFDVYKKQLVSYVSTKQRSVMTVQAFKGLSTI